MSETWAALVELCPLRLQVGYAITKMPEGFHLHKGVKRVYDSRRQMVESGEGVDWGMAEALAFGTLLSEGGLCTVSSAQSAHAWLDVFSVLRQGVSTLMVPKVVAISLDLFAVLSVCGRGA